MRQTDAGRRRARPPHAPRFRRVKARPFRITPRDIEIVCTVGRLGVVQSEQLDILYGARAAQNLRRRLYLTRPQSQRRNSRLKPGG